MHSKVIQEEGWWTHICLRRKRHEAGKKVLSLCHGNVMSSTSFSLF